MIGSQLQKAIHDALTAAPALAGGNVYDRVPAKAADAFPRITLGDEQVLDDSSSCGEGWEVYPDIHVWSRKPGHVEAKRIAADVVSRVLAIAAVDQFTLVEMRLESARSFTEPDGLTAHTVITFRVRLDPA